MKIQPRIIKGIGLGLMATCIWGGFYPVSRLVFGVNDESLEPLNFTTIRFMLAALCLCPMFFLRRNRELGKEMLAGNWRKLALLALVGVVVEGSLVFWALKYTTAARASLLANFSPVLTLLMSYFTGRELLNRNKVLGMFIGSCGLILAFCASGNDIFLLDGSTLIGDLLAFASGFCWSFYTVYSGDFASKYGGMLCCAVLFIIGSAMLLTASMLFNGRLDFRLPLSAWLGIAYLGVLSYALANGLWCSAMKFVTPGELGSLGFVSASLAILLSLLFLKERMSIMFVSAIVLEWSGMALMLKAK